MERAKEEAGEQTQVLADEIRMKERAKMQVEVKKVQEELDKVRQCSQEMELVESFFASPILLAMTAT